MATFIWFFNRIRGAVVKAPPSSELPINPGDHTEPTEPVDPGVRDFASSDWNTSDWA